MSAEAPALQDRERWLTFEVGGAAWALPIADVLEVCEVARIGRVPTLPRAVGGVMHYHGDALPVIARSALFDVALEDLAEPEQVVVIADRATDVARLGLPVDRVLGLVDGVPPASRQRSLVAARVPLEGRITGILDVGRLVARAQEVIDRSGESVETGNFEHGGET